MSVQTVVRPIATPPEQLALGTLMAERESPLSGAPLYAPPSAGVLVLGETPKESKDK